MAYVNGPPGIVTDGLVVHFDTMNYKSYTSGSTNWYNVANPALQNVTVNNTYVQIGDTTGYPLYSEAPNSPASPLVVAGTESIDFNRTSSFTMCVWASVHYQELVAPTTNTARGIWCRGSYGGFVGIYVQKQTTASNAIVYVGTRNTLGTTKVVQAKDGIQTGSYGEAEIFNVVMVYASASMSAYWNGNYAGETDTLAGSDGNYYFTGSYHMNSYGGIGGNGRPATMSIYNASIYNRILEAEEIKRNYDAQKGRYGI